MEKFNLTTAEPLQVFTKQSGMATCVAPQPVGGGAIQGD